MENSWSTIVQQDSEKCENRIVFSLQTLSKQYLETGLKRAYKNQTRVRQSLLQNQKRNVYDGF